MSPGTGSGDASLLALARSALLATTPEDLSRALVAAVGASLEVDQVHITQVSQDLAVGRARVIDLSDPEAPEERYTQVFDERPSGAAQVVATGEILHVPDARASSEIRADLTERFDVGSLLFLPLAWRGTVHHVAVLARRSRRPFSDGEILVAETIAEVAALGLALEESERNRAAQRQRDAALAGAARALNQETDLQPLLETLACQADRAVGGDLAGFYLGDGERGGVATAGHNAPDGWLGLVMAPGEGVAGQVLVLGEPIISNAYQRDVRLPPNPGLHAVQTAVSVPLRSDGRVIGALSVGFVRMRRVAEEDIRTLQAIADLAAVAGARAQR